MDERAIERSVRAASLRRDLRRRFLLANLDELLVIELLWQRLELGRKRYGPLDILARTIDWDEEELEEILDARIYRALAVVQRHERAMESLGAVRDRFDLSDTPVDLGEGEG